MENQSKEYVQYGCGFSAPPNWVNFDVSPTLRVQKIPLLGSLLTRNGPQFPDNVRYGDIVKGLPIPAQSCKAMYCSHVLEHLSLNDYRTALQNTRACLMPGGTFRFVLPDLEQLAKEYLASKDPKASIVFMESAYLGTHNRPRGFMAFLRAYIGNSNHLWMWDYPAMAEELRQAGFVDIRRAAFGDSEDPMFDEVEHQQRWDRCLGVESRRPE